MKKYIKVASYNLDNSSGSLDGFITSEVIDVINLGVIDNPNLSDHFSIFC